MSEVGRRGALMVLNRRTWRREPGLDRDLELRARPRELAEERRRFGSPRLVQMLRREGLVVNHKRVERLYREEGLSSVDLWDRRSPWIEADHSLTGERVARVLERLSAQGERPESIRTDNGPEFTGQALGRWAQAAGVRLSFIRPGRPMENGHIESFNGRFREECLRPIRVQRTRIGLRAGMARRARKRP